MGAGGIGALLKLRPPLPTIVSAPHQGSQGQEDRRQPQPVPQQVLHPRGSEKFPASHKPLHSTATLHRWGNRVPERNGNLLRSQVCITYKYILPREGRGASQPPSVIGQGVPVPLLKSSLAFSCIITTSNITPTSAQGEDKTLVFSSSLGCHSQ